jgi:MSHA pilin protein MshA
MKKKGFTLIELVMVIVIIGILAAVAVPQFVNLRTEAKIARCQADVGAIRTSLSSWYAKFHANGGVIGTSTPCNASGICNASGFPVAGQLNNATGAFAQFAFADLQMPPSGHIVDNTTCPNWGSTNCYNEGTGAYNITAGCTGMPY